MAAKPPAEPPGKLPRIVRSVPRGKGAQPARAPSPALPSAGKGKPAPEPATAPALTASGAIRVFLALIAAWRLPPARAWRMLTGLGYRAGSLSADQVQRVAQLAELDAIMQPIAPGSVGQWMVTPNANPVLGGSSPVDYLTRTGGPGYVALVRQAKQWAAM